jgi:hypothetical protein
VTPVITVPPLPRVSSSRPSASRTRLTPGERLPLPIVTCLHPECRIAVAIGQEARHAQARIRSYAASRHHLWDDRYAGGTPVLPRHKTLLRTHERDLPMFFHPRIAQNAEDEDATMHEELN